MHRVLLGRVFGGGKRDSEEQVKDEKEEAREESRGAGE